MGIWLPMPKVRARLLVASLLLLLAVNPLNAQRSGIDTYAITNARIVTVSGPVIERGTVVIRNGLIAAAGANVSAPPDARVIDGAGLTVYPGLIDSYTNLALPEAAPGPSPGGGGGGAFLLLQQQQQRPPSGPNSTQPAGLQPEVMVEDVIRPGGNEIEIERPRARGITNVIDGRNDLRRADQQCDRRDRADPENAREHFRESRRRVPAAIHRVEAEEETGLRDRRRLAEQKLQPEEERRQREVAQRSM